MACNAARSLLIFLYPHVIYPLSHPHHALAASNGNNSIPPTEYPWLMEEREPAGRTAAAGYGTSCEPTAAGPRNISGFWTESVARICAFELWRILAANIRLDDHNQYGLHHFRSSFFYKPQTLAQDPGLQPHHIKPGRHFARIPAVVLRPRNEHPIGASHRPALPVPPPED